MVQMGFFAYLYDLRKEPLLMSKRYSDGSSIMIWEELSFYGKNKIFIQDNAPSHRALDTVEFLRRHTPDFIGPDHWPPNSPDLSPSDYKIWGWMGIESTKHPFVM